MKKKFITMVLVLVLVFATTTTAFATLLTEDGYPTNGLVEELDYGYGDKYFMIKDTNGDYYVFTRNRPYIDTSNNNKVTWSFTNDSNLLCHKYNSKSGTWVDTMISGYLKEPVEIYVASYCCGNVDVYDQNGDVFFSITPLIPNNQQHQIVGGITAKQLQAPLMTILTSLLILVISLVILAMAFRKGWNLLLTVLKGA